MTQAALLMFCGIGPMKGGHRGEFKDAEWLGDNVPVVAGASVRWLKPVRPGDRVVISVEAEKCITNAAIVRSTATVAGRLVGRARLTLATAAL
jgi:3-hydroxymyristoyl/3-hydroxydecanoyl-(acyl carrier protein) dehydratase